jgi:hypothetical protein
LPVDDYRFILVNTPAVTSVARSRVMAQGQRDRA